MMARVMKERCAECLFTPGRIVSSQRMADVILECRRKNTHFCCHKGTIENQDVWCHGWWMAMETAEFRAMVEHMHLVEYVTEQDIKDAPAYMRDTHDEGDET